MIGGNGYALSVFEVDAFTTINGEIGHRVTTAQRAIERLERASIVKQMCDAKCDRIYCAAALLDILEELIR